MNEPGVIDLSQATSDPYQQYIESILPKVKLIESDDEPMESEWHVRETHLLINILDDHFRDRTDCYYAGNMFLYYSEEQARNRDFRGPDFFFLGKTHRHPMRPYWALWLENNRTPDVVIELCSPTTIHNDYGVKKAVYEEILHVWDYFCYDPIRQQLDGWRLEEKRYRALTPNDEGRLWSKELQLWVGLWRGAIGHKEDTWLRFFDANGNLVLTPDESAYQFAEDQKRRAEDEKRLRLSMEAELQQLRERLAALEKQSPAPDNAGKTPPVSEA